MNHKARRTGAMMRHGHTVNNTAYASQIAYGNCTRAVAQTVSSGITYQQSGGAMSIQAQHGGSVAQNGTSTTPVTGSTQGNDTEQYPGDSGRAQGQMTLIDPSAIRPRCSPRWDHGASDRHCGGSFGNRKQYRDHRYDRKQYIRKPADQVKAPEISSEAGVLYDATTGQFLFDKEAQSPCIPLP